MCVVISAISKQTKQERKINKKLKRKHVDKYIFEAPLLTKQINEMLIEKAN